MLVDAKARYAIAQRLMSRAERTFNKLSMKGVEDERAYTLAGVDLADERSVRACQEKKQAFEWLRLFEQRWDLPGWPAMRIHTKMRSVHQLLIAGVAALFLATGAAQASVLPVDFQCDNLRLQVQSFSVNKSTLPHFGYEVQRLTVECGDEPINRDGRTRLL